jgi:hypothetical protein
MLRVVGGAPAAVGSVRQGGRDVQQLQGGVGHYLISDRPLSEEEWIAQRTIVEQKRLPDATEVQDVPDISEETET